MTRTLLLILWGTAALAQSAFTPPLVGLFRDSQNRLRPVHGVAGSFLAGDPRLDDISSLAFSGRAGMAKTADSVVLLNAQGHAGERLDAPPGDALFAFDCDNAPAFIYFRETGELRSLRGSRRVLDLPGVAAIGAGGGGEARVLFLQDGRLWLAALFGGVPGAFTPVSFDEFTSLPPALLRADGGVVFVSGLDLVIRNGENERRVVLPGRYVGLEQMSEEWLLLRPEAGPALAVRLLENEERIFQLPEVQP